MPVLHSDGVGFGLLLRGIPTALAPRFIVERLMACPGGHVWMAQLRFSNHGETLTNSRALDCPVCGREGAVHTDEEEEDVFDT